MKLFVWNRVEGASGNYHDEGGIVVIDADLERAREMIVAETPTDDGRSCEALTQEPDLIRNVDGEEYIAIHPDAGCC